MSLQLAFCCCVANERRVHYMEHTIVYWMKSSVTVSVYSQEKMTLLTLMSARLIVKLKIINSNRYSISYYRSRTNSELKMYSMKGMCVRGFKLKCNFNVFLTTNYCDINLNKKLSINYLHTKDYLTGEYKHVWCNKLRVLLTNELDFRKDLRPFTYSYGQTKLPE